jgi:Tfp pilus assembly protein PilO
MLFIKEKKQIIVIALGAVMLGGFFLLRFLPLRNELSELKDLKEKQRLVIEKAQLQSKHFSALKEKKKQLENQVGDYDEKIPQEKRLGEFLQKIAALMDKYNLKDQVIEPAEQTNKDNLGCILINMKCTGQLEDFYRFFDSLQNMNRKVRIQDVQLKNDNNYQGNVNMNTKAVVYSMIDKKQG